jgi:hypothetical protein
MASYLVFVIAYCCQFPKLSICKWVNYELYLVTFWYQALWRHKDSLNFYEVYNDFLSFFKGLLFGKDTPRISNQENKFLDKKGMLEQMENHNVINIFCSKENPSFLPYHVSDKMFITEVERQYNFWLHLFHEKRKKQFIPLSWKIGDFIFRNINKIDEFVNHFHNVNLKYVEKIKGFDPNIIFLEHMLVVRFKNSFIYTIMSEEEDNNLGTTSHNVGDLETILITNEFYKKKGKGPSEKSTQSPVVTPKTTTYQSNSPMAHPTRKVTNNSSSGGGENNPSPGKIERSHKILLRKKRKNVVQEEECCARRRRPPHRKWHQQLLP